MRKGSKIISTLLLGATLGSVGTSVFAVESKDVISEKLLAGATRYESAIEVSKEGWKISDTAVLVNGTALSDALAATPYAKMKNAPILLTEMDKLSQSTKKELERLKVKNVSIVGGEGVVSKNVVNELQAMGIKTFRIFGKDRFETSLQVAEKLDAKAVAVVNGLDGRLADAMSIASPAAKKGMAVLLSDGKSLRGADKFVKDNNISETYVIGGSAVVSDENANSINAVRLGGKDRRETNGEVLKKFYDEKELKNIYVAKDGASKESELVDALSAGSLAAKEGAPVMLLGAEVSKAQKEFLKEKQIKILTQVGFGINEKSIKELYEVLNVTKGIEVSTVKELEAAIVNSKDGELIKFTTKTDVKENYEIKSNKEIVVELNGNFSGEIKVDMPKGDVINNGELKGKVNLNEIKSGTLLNNGTIHNIEVNDKTGSSIVNGKNGVVNKLTIGEKVKTYISGNVKEIVVEGKKSEVKLGGEINSVKVNGEEASVKIEKKSKIRNVEITGSAKGTKINNDGSVTTLKVSSNANDVKIDVTNGKVEKLEGNKNQVIGGNKNIGTITKPSTGGGASSGGGGSTSSKPETPEKPEIPQESKLDEAKKNAKNDLNKELERYKQEDYTFDNFNNINKIKIDADAMINEAKTEEEIKTIKVNASNEMNAVKTILFEVKEAFVLKVSEVNSKNLIEDNYTVESFGALQNALNFNIEGKTVVEINEAVVAIEKALEELKVSDLKIAKDAVGKAENTMKYEDVEATKTLIGKLPNGDTKDMLFERMYKAITIKNELGTTTIQFPYELREFNMTVKAGEEEKTVKMVVDGLKHELEVEGLKACESEKGFEYKDYKDENNNVVFTAYVENASRIRFVDNENSDEIMKITYKTIKESEKEMKEATEILNEKVSEVENKNLLEEDYTVESFGALQNALNFNIEGKTVVEINEAVVAIEKAMEELKVSDLKIAKDAVEKAENTMKYEDVEAAKTLIGKLPSGDTKDKLFERMYKAITIKNELGTTTIQFPYELREFNMTVKAGEEEKTVKMVVDGLKHELEVEGLKACESEKGFEYKDYKDENNNVVFTAYVENASRIRFVDNENSDEIVKITYKTEKDAKVEDKKELDNALEAIKNNSIKLSFEEFNKKENRLEKTKEYVDNLVGNKNIKISITKCDKDDFYKVSLKLNKESVNKTIEVKYTTSPQVVNVEYEKSGLLWWKERVIKVDLNEDVTKDNKQNFNDLFIVNDCGKNAKIEKVTIEKNMITIYLYDKLKDVKQAKVSYKGEEVGAIKNKDGNPLENFEEKIIK
ncbi:cell wall-binding repeat-containing protein [Clostridium ihumii]|uniref:cell wall-binding repeat-containing protein n=1 Tax=Clostridium ihumii TaxID=1470356 RepID=UPI003D32D98C